jgi:hypothetical protein
LAVALCDGSDWAPFAEVAPELPPLPHAASTTASAAPSKTFPNLAEYFTLSPAARGSITQSTGTTAA